MTICSCSMLMVAQEDHAFLVELAPVFVALVVHLQMQEARKQIEQAIMLKHFFPQIGGAIGAASWVGRVARAIAIALVEWQEVRRIAGQPRGHPRFFGINGEMHQCAALKLKDYLARIAIGAVLALGIFNILAGEWVLQLKRDNRNAVEAEREIEHATLLLDVAGIVVAQLARDAEDVGGVARF